ncbi:LuxR family transcriptional regulator [Vibrio intestinalis]|uniref:LuxR family transcriptional regulator n=1 Tax=Vibrio intestinalis TaxID=2933291 RepID=UPI0021A5D8C6|nr:LuxR family transcriptional regulator [Vibrio intestinalis]
MKEILRLVQENQKIHSVSELTGLLTKLNYRLENEYFLLGLSLSPSLADNNTLIIDSYPSDWREQYDQSGFIHIDPIVQYSAKNALPINWENAHDLVPNGSSLFEEARVNGLNAGFSIPIHGPQCEFGMLSFATSDVETFNANIDKFMLSQLFVPLISQNLPAITQREPLARNKVHLTHRETEVLSWASEGKSTWEISKILGCSERTVKFHFSNVCQKLGAVNRYQAISKAIVGGYIFPHY